MGFSQGHALLVGVGTYQDGSLSAPVTERDAGAVSLALQDPATAGYPGDQVTLLTGQAASKTGIAAALRLLAQQAKPDSSVLIFLCGHGTPGPQGEYYFLSYDARRAGPGSFDPSTVLSSAELVALIEGIPARKTLLV